MKKPLISVVVNTLNEEKNLPRCLDSIKKIADEIVVVDMYSDDNTVKVAKNYGAEVYCHKRTGYVEPARNFAINKAKGKWVLILDADEKINTSLGKKLKYLVEEKSDLECVLIPRKNIIFGKWMQNSRWWPDYLPRFFRRGALKWPTEIHQQPDLGGKKIHTLLDSEKLAIVHYNYENLDQFLDRGRKYAEIQAQELVANKNYKLSNKDLMIRPLEEFLSRFFTGEAYRDGIHGLALSLLQSWVVLLTYLKVWEMKKYEEKALEPNRVKEIMKVMAHQMEYWRDDFIVKSKKSAFTPVLAWLLKIRSKLVEL